MGAATSSESQPPPCGKGSAFDRLVQYPDTCSTVTFDRRCNCPTIAVGDGNDYVYQGRIVRGHPTDPFTTLFRGSASLCHGAKPANMVADASEATRWPQSIHMAIARMPELNAATLRMAAVSGRHTAVDGEPLRPVLNEAAWVDILARYAALRAPVAFDSGAALSRLDGTFTPGEGAGAWSWRWTALVALGGAVAILVAVAMARRAPVGDARPAWQREVDREFDDEQAIDQWPRGPPPKMWRRGAPRV
jgi:hypothetical protein